MYHAIMPYHFVFCLVLVSGGLFFSSPLPACLRPHASASAALVAIINMYPNIYKYYLLSCIEIYYIATTTRTYIPAPKHQYYYTTNATTLVV